jgi:hypothetical protein
MDTCRTYNLPETKNYILWKNIVKKIPEINKNAFFGKLYCLSYFEIEFANLNLHLGASSFFLSFGYKIRYASNGCKEILHFIFHL